MRFIPDAAISRKRRIRGIVVSICLGAAAAGLHAGVAAAEPSVEELESQVDKVSEDLEIIVEDYNKTAEDLKELEEDHEKLGESMDPLRERADAAAAEVGDIAAALYRGGPMMTVTPLLSGSTSTFADRLSVLDYLGVDRLDRLSELTDVADEYKAEELHIDELADEYDELKKDKADKEAEIADAIDELEETLGYAIAGGWSNGGGLPAPPIPGGDLGSATAAVTFAHSSLGAAYQWGGTGPGFDCSGLTSAAWSSAGVDLPHSAADQYYATSRVGRDQLQPGDLVFYYGDLHHVGMYVGEDKIIHAPTAGQTVQVSSVDEMPVQGYGRPA
ncbi:MAG: NlpC/P60 family protein [Stackebrandtia sp.]